MCSWRRAREHRIPMESEKDAREIPGSGVFVLVFGLVLLVVGGWIGWEFHVIWHTWPTADAEVIRGDVEESVYYPTARGGIVTHQFKPRIELRYTLHQKAYVTKAWLSAEDTRQKAQQRLLAAYPPASHHLIRCNPDDPTVIRIGNPEYSMMAFSAALLAAGLVLCAMAAGALGASRRVGVSEELGRGQRAKTSGEVIGIPSPAEPGPDVIAAIRCPSCGRQVEANQDTCPNCLKSLRAA